MSEQPQGILTARIVIENRLTDDDGPVVTYTADDGSGDDLPLIEQLGLLRMAEDTAIREAMGDDS